MCFNLIMIKITSCKNNYKNLFCTQYWEKVKKFRGRNNITGDLSYSFDLPEVNKIITGAMDNYNFESPMQEIIKTTDLEFKLFKPLRKKTVLWRGIPDKTAGEPLSVARLFNKCLNLKTGDKIMMPEYAYASDAKFYAEAFAKSGGGVGILYEIDVPKGSCISKKNIFPRCSVFECISNEICKDKGYRHIKLKYLSNKY